MNIFYRDCLSSELARRCDQNPRYSLRSFARALETPAGVVSRILSGKAIPSYKRALKLMAHLNLGPDKHEVFMASVAQAHLARKPKRLNPAFRKKQNVAPLQDLNLDLFRVIADWYHYGILMLTFVPEFKNDPKWIAGQLSISESEAMLAIERMKKLELLEEKNGKLIARENFTTAHKDITTPALRKHQRQILEKAIYSLENDPIEVRSVTSLTMAINPKKLKQAREVIARATQELSELLESGSRSQVYQLSMALYPLQKGTRL